jgi:HK97 family phage prohead protease
VDELERRITTAPVTLDTPQGMAFSGYAAMFNVRTEIGNAKGWGFYEEIAPSAFDRALKEGQDVRMLFNHNVDFLLARTSSGTLRLRTDATGLWNEAELPDTALGRDLSVLIQRRDISGQSFSFVTRKDSWETLDDGTELRTVLDLNLYDTGPVTFPAYEETTANVRLALRSAPQQVVKRRMELRADDDLVCDACGSEFSSTDDDVEAGDTCPDCGQGTLEEISSGRKRRRRTSTRAVWSAEYINDLADSAFAFIASGGEKDEEGKTTPRNLRYFPHHNTTGEVDLPHVRNGLSRAPQAKISDDAKTTAETHLQKHLDDANHSSNSARTGRSIHILRRRLQLEQLYRRTA